MLPQRFAFELKHQTHLITPGPQLFKSGNALLAFKPARLSNFGVYQLPSKSLASTIHLNELINLNRLPAAWHA